MSQLPLELELQYMLIVVTHPQAKWHAHRHHDSSKINHRGTKVGGGPIAGSPYPFSQIAGILLPIIQFSSVQLLSQVRLFATPWTAACQASLSITNSWSLLKPMSIESVMPSNHLILCHPLLLQPSIFPNIRVFSNESAHHIRGPKYWSFSFNISPSN